MRWRVKHYVLRSVICIPLVTWFFTPLGLQALWIQLTLGLTGYFSIGLSTVFALFAYFVCGTFVGLGQMLRRMDGE